jgi:hypothetical protein
VPAKNPAEETTTHTGPTAQRQPPQWLPQGRYQLLEIADALQLPPVATMSKSQVVPQPRDPGIHVAQAWPRAFAAGGSGTCGSLRSRWLRTGRLDASSCRRRRDSREHRSSGHVRRRPQGLRAPQGKQKHTREKGTCKASACRPTRSAQICHGQLTQWRSKQVWRKLQAQRNQDAKCSKPRSPGLDPRTQRPTSLHSSLKQLHIAPMNGEHLI